MIGSVRRKFFNQDSYENKFPQYKQSGEVIKSDDRQGRLADLLADQQ